MILTLLMLLSAQADSVPSPPEPPAPSVGSLPVRPVNNPGSWVTSADYPARSLRDRSEGTAGFRLDVGPDGLPRRCEITASSGDVDLDDATCRLIMERARFQVQRDAKGVRVGGTYANRIRWQMPDDYLEQLARSGFHVDEERAVWPRAPIADPSMVTLDGADHYPAAALAARQEGDVRMTLAVDATGKVAGCAILIGSGVASLDEAACALMRSAGKFDPALDSMGNPVKARVPATFSWTLPRAVAADGQTVKAPPPVRKFPMSEAGSATMIVDVGADGAVADCRFVKGGSFASLDGAATPCDTIGGTIRYLPFVDAAGQPVARRVTMRSEVTIEAAPAAKGAANQ